MVLLGLASVKMSEVEDWSLSEAMLCFSFVRERLTW